MSDWFCDRHPEERLVVMSSEHPNGDRATASCPKCVDKLDRYELALQFIAQKVDHVGMDHEFGYCNDIAKKALE